MAKVKVATTWLQSCSGCHISLLDLHEEILDLLPLLDIKFSPLVDIKDLPEVDVGVIEGSVANEENEEMAKELRKKARTIVALGTCAVMGGIPGFRNLYHRKEVLNRAFIETPSTEEGKLPSGEIPRLLQRVKPLFEVIKVDYELPGCPPVPRLIKQLLVSLVEGKEFSLPRHNLCEECTRIRRSILEPKRGYVSDAVYVPMEIEQLDEEICFLEQGLICVGLATREGCGARCIQANFPCRGCMGPTPDALEQGAKMVNALASILPAGSLMFLEDIVGLGYRYSTAVSIYPTIVREGRKNEKS